MQATQIVEALLFASDAPLAAEDLARGEEDLDVEAVEAAVAELRRSYEDGGRAFQIYEIAGGYQVLTRPEMAPYLERFETVPQPSRLSGPALEVLAIVAYRQPIGRAEIERIRGVGSSAVLRTLQERELIEVVGRAEGLGRPLLYGTTLRFLDHFGFRGLEDLPRPEDLPVVLLGRQGEAGVQSMEGAPGEAGVQSMDRDGETGGMGDGGMAGEESLASDESVPGEEQPAGAEGGAGEEHPAGAEGGAGEAGVERVGSVDGEDVAAEAEPAGAVSPSPRPPVSPSGGEVGKGDEGGEEKVVRRPDILDDVSPEPDEE